MFDDFLYRYGLSDIALVQRPLLVFAETLSFGCAAPCRGSAGISSGHGPAMFSLSGKTGNRSSCWYNEASRENQRSAARQKYEGFYSSIVRDGVAEVARLEDRVG